MTEELAKALVDVRKAYRLIYLYQKNVLSTIERFAQEFSCVYYWWTPTEFATPPNRGTDITKRWAWDLLPLYAFAILYRSEDGDNTEHSPGDWLLSFQLTTDTSYESGKKEPDPRTFDAPEESETTLIISLWYCKKAISSNWYWGIWNETDYPENVYQEYDSPKGLVCVKKEYLLEELETEDSILRATNEFKELLSKYIPDENW